MRILIATLVVFVVCACEALAFDGALVTRTTNQKIQTNNIIVWQASSYEEGGNWWRSGGQPSRLYVVNGVSKVRVRFSVTLTGPSTGRVCAFAAYYKAGVRTFMAGIPANCVNADQVGATGLQVHSPPIAVAPGDFFEFAIAFTSNERGPEVFGEFGVTWASIEKVE